MRSRRGQRPTSSVRRLASDVEWSRLWLSALGLLWVQGTKDCTSLRACALGRGVVEFRKRTLERLGDLICGNLGSDAPRGDAEPPYFHYRSSRYITECFGDLDMDWEHDGSTRHRWVAGVLECLLAESHEGRAPSGVFLSGDRPP